MEIFEVKQSAIEGRGVFANLDFKKGEKIEINLPTISYEQYDRARLKLGAGRKREYFLTANLYVFDLRKSALKYLNHSDTPNMDWNDFEFIVLRDIKKGEEITINYGWANYRWN